MKTMRIHLFAAMAAGVLLGLTAPAAMAQAKGLHVFSGNGVKAVLDDVRAQAERAIGQPLVIDYSTSATLLARINRGEVFDVTIIASDAIAELAKQGKLAPGGRGFARAGVGIGARAGAAKVAVGTSDAFKQAMLKSKGIALTIDGASRATSEKAFAQLGITSAMAPKIRLYPAGYAPESVVDGETEYVLTLISEILPVKGLQLMGPFPKDLQVYTSFGIGMSAKSKNPAAAKALLQFLSRPEIAQTIKARGMEPLP